MKTVSLRLGGFGQGALDDHVRGGGGSRARVVETAVRYYLADSDSGRAAWPVPELPSGWERV